MGSKLNAAGVAAMVAILGAAAPAAAATIILNNIGGVDPGTQAFQGFTTAANFWASEITNPITIELDVGFGHLGPHVLGQTSATGFHVATQSVEGQLIANATSSVDLAAITHMPTLTPSAEPDLAGLGGLSVVTPGYTDAIAGTGIDNSLRVLDNNGSFNNVALTINAANARALGFGLPAGTIDGSIAFSSDFNFDFNPTDGIAPDAIDFVGVATHEIGHALGFSSGVDTYDVLGLPKGPLAGQACLSDGTLCQNYPAQDDAFGTPLDLFRYAKDPLGTGTGDPALTWVPGVESYFSLDGGATPLGGFSTGAFNGDTWQASHWKRTPGETALGIMDPAVSFGQEDVFSNLDFEAFDAIGYNFNFDPGLDPHSLSTADISRMFRIAPLPEPQAWALMILGFGAVGVALRRERRRPARA
ncbi:MAG TPA: NF038122 family metalloprotease [Phenylobacterium sp.]|jgi:hypothetical protein